MALKFTTEVTPVVEGCESLLDNVTEFTEIRCDIETLAGQIPELESVMENLSNSLELLQTAKNPDQILEVLNGDKSIENLLGIAEGQISVKAATEGLGEAIVNAWKKLVAFVVSIYDKIRAWFRKIFEVTADKKDLEAVLNDFNEARKDSDRKIAMERELKERNFSSGTSKIYDAAEYFAKTKEGVCGFTFLEQEGGQMRKLRNGIVEIFDEAVKLANNAQNADSKTVEQLIQALESIDSDLDKCFAKLDKSKEPYVKSLSLDQVAELFGLSKQYDKLKQGMEQAEASLKTVKDKLKNSTSIFKWAKETSIDPDPNARTEHDVRYEKANVRLGGAFGWLRKVVAHYMKLEIRVSKELADDIRAMDWLVIGTRRLLKVKP